MESVEPSAPPPAGAGLEAFHGAVWVERQAEARKVLDFVLAAGSKLVILYGKHGVGKTALVLRWIIPLAPAEYDTFYGDCAPALPERVRGASGEQALWTAAGRRALIFLDSFERLLDLPEARREELVADLCARVRAPECAATLVLVLDGDHLGRAFALRAPLTEVAQAAMEIKGVGTLDSVAALTTLAGRNALDCEPAVLEALAREAEALDSKVEGISPELLQVIGEELRRLRRGSQQPLGIQEYQAIGGLEDLLRGFLYRQIANLPNGGDGPVKEVGITILEEIAVARRAGRPADFSGLPERLEMTGADLQKALAWLQNSGGLLRQRKDGGFDLMPQGLAAVVEKEATRRRLKTKELQWILREGARIWAQLGTPLAREAFERIDRHRHQLEVTDEEAELGLQGALRYQGEETLRGARYWLRRIRSDAARVDALLLSVFDPLPVVRAKAALLLGGFHQPEVRDQLYMLALQDPEPGVRDAAVQGLREVKNEALRDLLLQESRDAGSPFRGEAVNASRIFPDERTVGVLKALVQDSACPEPVRVKAIEVLSALQIPAASEVLVDIAIHDQDLVDRRGAAAGLGVLQAEILVRGCLEKLRKEGSRPPRPEGPRGPLAFLPFAGRAALAIAVGLANLVVHGLALLHLRRYLLAGVLLGTEAAGAALLKWSEDAAWLGALLVLASLCAAQVIPAALLLRERRAGRLEAGSFQGLLAVPLFATTSLLMVSWLHGLAHALIGRWRRAGLLFLGEVVGLAVWWGTWAAVANGLEAPILELYSWLGLLLFWGTLVYDVVQVCRDALLRNELAERRWEVYGQLLRGRVAPGLVLEGLASAKGSDARWARSLLRRWGGEIEPAVLLDHLNEKRPARRFVVRRLAEHKRDELIHRLGDLWSTAAPELKRTILTILARRPTEASLAALRRLRPDLDARQRLRIFWSPWHFRIRVWPRGALLLGGLALPLLSWAVYEGIGNKVHPYRPGIRVVQNEAYEDDEPRIATAEYLARVYPDVTVTDLAGVFRTTGEPHVRLGLAHSLKIIATKEGNLVSGKQALRELVLGLERWPEPQVRNAIVAELVAAGREAPGLFDAAGLTARLEHLLHQAVDLPLRRAALAVLEAAGEVESLRAFVAGPAAAPGEGGRPRADELVRRRLEEALRGEAIAALGRIGTLESIGALRALAASSLPETLSAQVREEVDHPLQPLAAAYENGKYQQVSDEAQRLLDAPPELVARPALLNLLGKAQCSLARSAADAREAGRMRRHCIEHLEAARAAAGVDEEALRLLATSYLSEADVHRAAGRFNQALALTRLALAADPSLASARGSSYLATQAAAQLDVGQFEPARKALLAAIAGNPDDAWSFHLLRQSYVREGRLREGETMLRQLGELYPASREPELALAYLYHEDLSRTDPQAYGKALQVLDALARSKPLPDVLVQLNLAEAQLTAGRYRETVDTVRKILPAVDPDTALSLRFLQYAAQLLLGEAAAALETLAALETQHRALPAGFRNGWNFGGTFRFLQASRLPPQRKRALLALGELIEERQPDARAAEIFAGNRAALER